MNRDVLIPSLIIGIIFSLFYAYRCHKFKTDVDMGVLLNSLLNGGGIVGGLFLFGWVCYGNIEQNIKGNELYVAVGGFAVLVISIQGYYRNAIVPTKINKKSEVKKEIDIITDK